jgi:hypothetical protein
MVNVGGTHHGFGGTQRGAFRMGHGAGLGMRQSFRGLDRNVPAHAPTPMQYPAPNIHYALSQHRTVPNPQLLNYNPFHQRQSALSVDENGNPEYGFDAFPTHNNDTADGLTNAYGRGFVGEDEIAE